jgi:manganese transport protein
VKKYLQIALGVIAALGFVDIGELVFNTQAGSLFGYKTLWAVPLGVIGITVFAELSGRVAIATKKANFDLVRERYPRWLSTTTMVAGRRYASLRCRPSSGDWDWSCTTFWD